jgi:hypothetical protein
MAESKSAEYANKINGPSEFSSSVHPLTALRNFLRSECRRFPHCVLPQKQHKQIWVGLIVSHRDRETAPREEPPGLSQLLPVPCGEGLGTIYNPRAAMLAGVVATRPAVSKNGNEFRMWSDSS